MRSEYGEPAEKEIANKYLKKLIVSRQRCLFGITVQFFFFSRQELPPCVYNGGTTMMNPSNDKKIIEKCTMSHRTLYRAHTYVFGYEGERGCRFLFFFVISTFNVLFITMKIHHFITM